MLCKEDCQNYYLLKFLLEFSLWYQTRLKLIITAVKTALQFMYTHTF